LTRKRAVNKSEEMVWTGRLRTGYEKANRWKKGQGKKQNQMKFEFKQGSKTSKGKTSFETKRELGSMFAITIKGGGSKGPSASLKKTFPRDRSNDDGKRVSLEA